MNHQSVKLPKGKSSQTKPRLETGGIFHNQELKKMTYLFNTTIMPNEGVFSCKKITLERAKELYSKAKEITSAIGHNGSAEVFTALGMPAVVNRIAATMKTGDRAICLKVLGRIPEGAILDFEELTKVGFELFQVMMIADSMQMLEDQASYEGAAPINGHIWPL